MILDPIATVNIIMWWMLKDWGDRYTPVAGKFFSLSLACLYKEGE